MSRYFAPISIDALKEKIEHALSQHLGGSDLRNMRELTPIVKKDVKVTFDQENITGGGKGWGPNPPPLGYHTLDNGLTFCGVQAGGDWEYPVFWITYWDGTKLRAYVPTDGNPWNTSTKEAYGNDPKADLKNAKKRYPKRFEDFDEEEGDYFDAHDLSADGNLIIKDIKERILPR